MAEKILISQTVEVERKKFDLSVRENDRGKILRITEEAAGKRNTVIIPFAGVEEVMIALDQIIDAAGVHD